MIRFMRSDVIIFIIKFWISSLSNYIQWKWRHQSATPIIFNYITFFSHFKFPQKKNNSLATNFLIALIDFNAIQLIVKTETTSKWPGENVNLKIFRSKVSRFCVTRLLKCSSILNCVFTTLVFFYLLPCANNLYKPTVSWCFSLTQSKMPKTFLYSSPFSCQLFLHPLKILTWSVIA